MFKFKFKYVTNETSDAHDVHSLYLLNESHQIVPEHEAKKFILKKRNPLGGFKEFFGVINNSHHDPDSPHPVPDLPFIEEEEDIDPYYIYGLDKILYLKEEEKTIPIYTPHQFIDLVPKSFGGETRTLDVIASSASNNRQAIYEWYKKLDTRFIKTLTEVNCNTVAFLYEYLNDEKWKEGMEFFGFVSGLFEVGGYLTISLDDTDWSIRTATHELGHAVSYYLNQELFQEYLVLALNKSEFPTTEYGRSEVSEDFAESFSFYFGSPSDRDALKRMCPVRHAYMQKLEKEEGSALVSTLEPSIELTRRFKKYDAKPYN